MGIDPGVANTGFGVVRVAGGAMSAVDGGVIEAPADLEPAERLARIHSALGELIAWHEPAAIAIEELYFGKNVRSAIGVGQARGVAMLAAAERGIPCFDYTPQAVKMAVCGSGAAAKAQVQRMVGALLHLPSPPASDHAADALAVAICHASRAPATAATRRSGVVIASVRGEVLVRRPDHVVIETGGVGYRLAVSAETLKAVPAHGKQATLHAHLVVRDDAMQLYGFASEEERDLFVHLNSVSGVGPKMAIAILSGGSPRELLKAIALGDHKRFQAAPGVGKRTAERVIVELREKVAGELEQAHARRHSRRRRRRATAARARGPRQPRLHAASRPSGCSTAADGDTPEDLIGAALRAAAGA